jgi:hypothetical protein
MAYCSDLGYPSPGGVAQLVERVLYHSTRRAVPERSWVQSLLPTTEVEPGFSTFGGMLVPVLQLISPVCKTGTSLCSDLGCFSTVPLYNAAYFHTYGVRISFSQ